MTIVEESGGQYHVLLIIADGQACMHLLLDLSAIYRLFSYEKSHILDYN